MLMPNEETPSPLAAWKNCPRALSSSSILLIVTSAMASSGSRRDVRGLRPLRALDDLELDLLSLVQRLEAFAGDACVMDEAVALGVVEPLHDPCCHLHTCLGLVPISGRMVAARPRLASALPVDDPTT